MSRDCFELLLRQLHHQIRFPTEEILGVVGSKNLWHPFTATPDREVILVDIRNR